MIVCCFVNPFDSIVNGKTMNCTRSYKSKYWAMRTSTFYPVIPILLHCTSLQLLWPLQIPKNFKFKPIFLVFCHLKMRLVHHLPHHMLLIHVMNYHPLSCLMQHVMKINRRMLLKKYMKIMRNLKFSNSLNHSLAMGGICGGWQGCKHQVKCKVCTNIVRL